MTEILYHGSRADIKVIDRDICLTDDPEIAASYLAGRGWVYTVQLSESARIADEDEVYEAAAAAAAEDRNVAMLVNTQAWVFELLDQRSVRDELAARGWHGVRYRDANPENALEHDTIRIWAAGIAQIINREGQ